MVKGTDLVMSVQLLILRYSYFLTHYKAAFNKWEKTEDENIHARESFGSFFKLKEELRLQLERLGNECDHLNIDNLRAFAAERQFPDLPVRDVKDWVFKTVEQQLYFLIESYQRVLRMKTLPINVESVMLRHLAELQTTTCDFLNRRCESKNEMKQWNIADRALVIA